jgi:hypothetical protein
METKTPHVSKTLSSLSELSNPSDMGILPPSTLPIHLHAAWKELVAEEAAERADIIRTADAKRANIIRRAIVLQSSTLTTTVPLSASSSSPSSSSTINIRAIAPGGL